MQVIALNDKLKYVTESVKLQRNNLNEIHPMLTSTFVFISW